MAHISDCSTYKRLPGALTTHDVIDMVAKKRWKFHVQYKSDVRLEQYEQLELVCWVELKSENCIDDAWCFFWKKERKQLEE